MRAGTTTNEDHHGQRPRLHSPNTTFLPSSQSVLTMLMKNCEPLESGPRLACGVAASAGSCPTQSPAREANTMVRKEQPHGAGNTGDFTSPNRVTAHHRKAASARMHATLCNEALVLKHGTIDALTALAEGCTILGREIASLTTEIRNVAGPRKQARVRESVPHVRPTTRRCQAS